MILGESDLTWRNKIIDWIVNNEKHVLIIYDRGLFIEKNISPQAKLNLKDDKVDEIEQITNK